jgi:mycothiol S-conjugate amidase
MADQWTIMTVHAHPDDEASKGAPTLAKYHDQGVKTVLVCCTGGEEGDLQNPLLREPGQPFHGLTPEQERELVVSMRPAELARSAEVIGFDEVIMLGYRDSGMAETEPNEHPDCFHQADLDEATGRLVGHIRRTKPQVIITYSDDQQGYPHPDHLRVHDISLPAFDRAADAEWYPEAGEPWQPLKMYYTTWSRARMVAMHEKFIELGMESPWAERWDAMQKRPDQEHRITARVPIDGFQDARTEGLLAHATQIDPTSAFWFGLPKEVADTVHPFDDYILARSLVDTEESEDDLFAGIDDLDWEPLA